MIRETAKIRELEDAWKELIDSDHGPIYLNYEFHKLVYRDFKYRKILKRSFRNKKQVYVCNVKEDRVVAIAPLVVDHSAKMISFIGQSGEAGYNDFIYEETCPAEYLSEIVEYIKKRYAGYAFKLVDLRAESKLCRLYDTEFHQQCFRIEIRDGYDGWYHSLSKSTRATIRGAYNRLENDNAKVAFCFTDKVSLPTMMRIYFVYEKRLLENRTHEAGLARPTRKDIIRTATEYIPKFIAVPFFLCFNKIARARIGYLTINGKIAAFMMGYLEGDGWICPRCGLDSKFARYSPGLINNIEIIKRQTQNGKPFIFDLSRGYHEYKARMDGIEYDNLKITM